MNKYLKTKPLEAILWLFSSLIIVSASVYKLYALNWTGVIISLILTLTLWFGVLKIGSRNIKPEQEEKIRIKDIKLKDWLLSGTYLVLIGGLFYILGQSRSDKALVTPWSVIPGYFFIIYFLATALLLFLIVKAGQNRTKKFLNSILISLHYFLSFIIAVIVYRIGYGYDPFIHQATMDLIDKQGAVEPKPFYYLGQYGLLITIHKLSNISLIILDKLLVPVTAAVFLPSALAAFINRYFPDQKNWQLLLLAIMVIPFSCFILSTPQNLAFLLLILTVLYSATDYRLSLALSLATCLVHPLAGIPALTLGLLVTIDHFKAKINRKMVQTSYLGLFLLTLLGLPIAFYLSGQSQLTWKLESFSSYLLTLMPQLHLPYKETWLLNLTYFYGQNQQLIITLLIIGGLILVSRRHRRDFRLSAPIITALAVLGSFFLVSQLSFNLISYEQNDFAQRLLIVSVILMLPAIVIALGHLQQRISNQDRFYRISFFIMLAALITVSLYISYPRQDHYYNSKAYAVSASDQEAVNWIENQTKNPYIVLANQQTGAVALRSFGFNRYHHNLYFYPIPTSSPLYQYFLNMVYDYASRETMIKAMDLAQVDEAYFVIPKYWWAFSRIVAEAKLSADSWQSLDEGQIYIFKYSR